MSSDTTRKLMISTNTNECRACLGKICGDGNSSDLFHAWDPPWTGMGISIAEDLIKITNVQITPSDSYSKCICTECRGRLQDAISFVSMVQNRDLVLRTRQIKETPSWPKPIQVDKGLVISTMNLDVQVKQEILSDNECEMLETYSEQSEPRLDIKIEPEEMSLATHPEPQLNLPPTVEVNYSATTLNAAETTLRANCLESIEDEEIQHAKDEPISEEDSDSAVSDDNSMPNDCMLCMKSFNTVKGLKAHVIAAHSYDTIISSQVYKEKDHVCKTCHRSFATRTDLYVHETLHSKFECCVCHEKFDSFSQLTKHRCKQCGQTAVMPQLRTLEDVRRPLYIVSDKNLSQSTNSTLKTEDPKQIIDTKITEHSDLVNTPITLECRSNEDVKLEKTVHKPLCVIESNVKNEEKENESTECLLQPDLSTKKTCDNANNTCLLTTDIGSDYNQISEENIPIPHGNESTEKIQDFSDDETKNSEDLSLEERIRFIVGESNIDDSNHNKKAQDSDEKSIKSHDNECTKSSISVSLLDNKSQESKQSLDKSQNNELPHSSFIKSILDNKPQEPKQLSDVPQVIDLTKSRISESISVNKLQEPKQPLDVKQDVKLPNFSIIEFISDNKTQEPNLTESENNKIDCQSNENKLTVEDIDNVRRLTNKPVKNILQESSSNSIIENDHTNDGKTILSEEKTQSQQSIEGQSDLTTETKLNNKLGDNATENGELVPRKKKIVDLDLSSIDGSVNMQLEIHNMHSNDAMDVDMDQNQCHK